MASFPWLARLKDGDGKSTRSLKRCGSVHLRGGRGLHVNSKLKSLPLCNVWKEQFSRALLAVQLHFLPRCRSSLSTFEKNGSG